MSLIREINPGRFNKRVEVWSYENQEDDRIGGKKTSLTRKMTVWAELKPTRGTEFLEYYREANELQYKVTMRYPKKPITEKDVLIIGKRQFEINAVVNINESNVYLEIYCTESKDKEIDYAGQL